jgi:D-alanine-D-alanine ligase
MNGGVLVLYNALCPAAGARNAEAEAGVLDEVRAVEAALAELGLPRRTAAVGTLREAGRVLAAAPEPRVFNLVESLAGSAEDACLVPSVCAALGKAWTGSGTVCQLLALNKWQAKCALRAAGVPVPDGTVVPRDSAASGPFPEGPIIVKPLCADASEGIDATSVLPAASGEAFGACVARVHRAYGQAALVEQYLPGREFNIALFTRGGVLDVLPPAEIDFEAFPPGRPRIVDYRAKWIAGSFEYIHTPRRVPADVDAVTARRLCAAARAAWSCLGCRGYARVDLRLDAGGTPCVIEVNPNPDIAPDAGFAAALQAAHVPYASFVRAVLDAAGGAEAEPVGVAAVPAGGGGLEVGWSRPEERGALLDLVAATGVFRVDEIDVAREVLDAALEAGPAGHYQSYTARRAGAVAGWACMGPTPCTQGTVDLYWLAVHPAHARRGVGRALLARIEAEARARGARLVVVETSSRADYAPARRFYVAHGYTAEAAVADFYAPGDDKLVYLRRCAP